MKTARLLLTIVALGALTLGRSYAGQPSKPPAEQNLRQLHATHDRPASPEQAERKQSLSHNNGHASEKSSRQAPLKTPTQRASANELRPPGLKKAAPTAAHGGWTRNKIENHHEPAQGPGGGGTTAPWPGVSRHRSATTAALGGGRTSSAKNSTAALDGAAMRIKH
jgi:hypothetical protein